MSRLASLLVTLITIFPGVAYAAPDIIRQQLPQSIPHYLKWGSLFVDLQVNYFKVFFLVALIAIVVVEFLHYVVIGPKKYRESGNKIKVYNLFMRIVHWVAALSFTLLVPTGLIMVFGKFFGGGGFVRTMRVLHFVGAVLFVVSVIPLFFMWVLDMLPESGDIKWFLVGGGYLTKRDVETGAGKFNPGQKIWFWIATVLGSLLLITGFLMYLREPSFVVPFVKYQIDSLRLAAIIHNLTAVLVLIMFLIHLYMSLFAVRGSLRSMITGYKDEEEVRYMHSSFYEKIKKQLTK